MIAARGLIGVLDPADPGRSADTLAIAHLSLGSRESALRAIRAAAGIRGGARGIPEARGQMLLSRFLSDYREPGGLEVSLTAIRAARLVGEELYGRTLVGHASCLHRYGRRAEISRFTEAARGFLPPNGNRWHVALEVNHCAGLVEDGRFGQARELILRAASKLPRDSAGSIHILWSAAHIAAASDFSAQMAGETVAALQQAMNRSLAIGREIEALLIALDLTEVVARARLGDHEGQAEWHLRRVKAGVGDRQVAQLAASALRLSECRELTLEAIAQARLQALKVRRRLLA